MRNLTEAVNNLDLIDRVYRGRQSTMNAEDLVAYDHRQRKVIEHVGEVVPYGCGTVFARAFGVEAVGLGDAAGLVVAADELDAGGVAEFEADEEADCFDAEKATVHVVTWACQYAISS